MFFQQSSFVQKYFFLLPKFQKFRFRLPGCENPVPDGPLAKIKKELLEGSTEHIPEIYKMYGNVESTLGDFLKGVRVPLAKAQVQADLAVVKIKDKLSRATAETLEELETEFHAAIKASSEFLTGDEKEDAQRNQKHADAQDVEEKFESFRVLSEMRGKNLYYNPIFLKKNRMQLTKMHGKCRQNFKIDL